jgi:hypothetical protein
MADIPGHYRVEGCNVRIPGIADRRSD